MDPTFRLSTTMDLDWGNEPFITNGISHHPQFEASESKSDTTAIMFNMDSLNEERSETRRDQNWAKGCIPGSPDSFVESFVQRVNRGRFRFELGGPSNGPRLVDPQEAEIQNNANGQRLQRIQELGSLNGPPQSVSHASPPGDIQPNNVDFNIRNLNLFELLTLGPGPSQATTSPPANQQNTEFWCSENWDTAVRSDSSSSRLSSRKRIKKEIESFGRNIKQRLCWAVFAKCV